MGNKKEPRDYDKAEVDDTGEPETVCDAKSPVPLDHGWAWFVLFGAVLVMGIFIGLMKASGILFVAFQQRFKATSAMTSLLSTVQNAAQSVSAIFVMNIGVKLTSCRVLVLIGSILICVSYIITSQAEDILWLFISYGVLLGVGSACVVPTTVSMVGHYFDKRRGFANSMAVSGGSLGGLLFAPLITMLLEYFGYNGCMLILAGINLQICISAVLFRPLSYFTRLKNKVHKIKDMPDEKYKQRNRLSSDVERQLNDNDLRKSLLVRNTVTMSVPSAPSPKTNRISSENMRKPRSESLSVTVGDRKVEVESLLLGSLPNIPSAVEESEYRPRTFTESSVQRIKKTITNNQKSRKRNRSSSDYICGSHMDISGFLQIPEEPTSDDEVFERQTRKEKPNENNKKQQKGTLTLASFFDFDLLLDPIFLLMSLSFGLLCTGTLLCMIYIAPYATDIGISPQDISTILQISSGIDLVARILTGILADQHWFRRSTIVGTCATIVGIACSVLELYNSFELLVVFAVILGLVSGAYFALSAVIIVDYLSVQKLQSVLGFMTLSNAVFVAGGFYAMGAIRDATGSYVASYHLISAMTLTGAAILFLLPLVEKWKKRKPKGKKKATKAMEIVVKSDTTMDSSRRDESIAVSHENIQDDGQLCLYELTIQFNNREKESS